MSDHMTEPFEPYRPDETAYEWDDAPEPGGGPRVLWGRLAVLAVALLIAFFAGRACAPSGIAESDFAKVQAENKALADENASLKAAAAQPSVSPSPSAGASESPAAVQVEGKTYVVQSGDTLRGIAQKYYDDPSLDDFIADANGISDPTQLSVGLKLTIPPKPND